MRLVAPTVFDGPEELRVTLEDDFLTFRASGPARLVPERGLELALALLELLAPDLMHEVKRAVRAQRIRLVEGGGGGDAA